MGDEALLSGVKPAQRRVARGTPAGSVVVEELVPFSGVIWGRGKEGRSRAPVTLLVQHVISIASPPRYKSVQNVSKCVAQAHVSTLTLWYSRCKSDRPTCALSGRFVFVRSATLEGELASLSPYCAVNLDAT